MARVKKTVNVAIDSLLSQITPDMLSDALVTGGWIMANQAKRNAHVITGELRRSITVRPVVKRKKMAMVAVQSNKVYAHVEELRTGHAFMRPAYEQTRDDVVKEVVDTIREAIRRGL